MTCLKSYSKLVEESGLKNRAPDSHSGKRPIGGIDGGCHSWPGWGLGTAHTLDSSGFFSVSDTNSGCCRAGLGMVALVASSLSCCLRMAKIKAKQTREPVLKKNWSPINLGKIKGLLNSGPPHPGLGCPWAGAEWGQQLLPMCSGRH